jgi:hypothetical protein
MLRADANPSMNVARWYAPEAAITARTPSSMLWAGANPSMNVALWYVPAGSSALDLLCTAEDFNC